MNVVKCENGHHFDTERYNRCPICVRLEKGEDVLSFSKEKPKQPELKFHLVLPKFEDNSYNHHPLYCCVMYHPRRSAIVTPNSYTDDGFYVVHNDIVHSDSISINHPTINNIVTIEFSNSKYIDNNNSNEIIVNMQWNTKVSYSLPLIDSIESWDFVVSEAPINSDIDAYCDGYYCLPVNFDGHWELVYICDKDLAENQKNWKQLYNEKDNLVVKDDVLIEYLGSSADIVIPNNVKHIGNFVFVGFEKITSITIPDSVISIGAWAFKDCTNLTSITIPDSVTSIRNGAFYNTGYYNNPDNWENGVLYLDNCLIKAETSVNGSYTVKNGIKIIADNAFDSCTKLTTVIIPDSVTTIGHHAFQNCTQLVSTTIGSSVTHIGTQAFKGCISLSSATIPDSVVIGFEAFCDYWKSKGLCTSCGGKFKGLLNKKCSHCGTPKVVIDAESYFY